MVQSPQVPTRGSRGDGGEVPSLVGERKRANGVACRYGATNCFYLLGPEVPSRGEVESFGPALGTCTSDSVKKSGLGWPSHRLSDA
ncbi:hypothetical protein ACLB2K_065932 [Fragaria x ananassa]